jgi:hypothetical protein
MGDPDEVATEAQLDALVDELGRRAVERAAKLEIAIDRHAHRPTRGRVEHDGWERPQRCPVCREPLVDDEAAGRVAASMGDAITPVGVLLIELAKRRDPPGRPEARFEVAHRPLDRALLARRRRRAGGRVERVVAAQMQKPRIPDDDVLLAAGDSGAQIVVDAGTPPSHANARTCPSRNDSIPRSKLKNAVCAPEYGSDAISAYTRRSRPPIRGRLGISAQSNCATCPGRYAVRCAARTDAGRSARRRNLTSSTDPA